MSSSRIDAIVTSADPLSPELEGANLLLGTIDRSHPATLQIEPMADGDFEVHLESRVIVAQGELSWRVVGAYDQDEQDENLQRFLVSHNSEYRFKHISGVACRCVLVP